MALVRNYHKFRKFTRAPRSIGEPRYQFRFYVFLWGIYYGAYSYKVRRARSNDKGHSADVEKIDLKYQIFTYSRH